MGQSLNYVTELELPWTYLHLVTEFLTGVDFCIWTAQFVSGHRDWLFKAVVPVLLYHELLEVLIHEDIQKKLDNTGYTAI